MNIIQNKIHQSHKKDRLNILVLLFNGDFEYNFAKLNHELFVIGGLDKIEKYEAINGKPPNITFFPVKNENAKISKITPIDLIIINGRIDFGLGKKLQLFYQCPIIIVEQDTPELLDWQKKQINTEVRDTLIVSQTQVIFKHWDNIGILIENNIEWQDLLYKLTKGGFTNETICNIQ